MALQKRKPVVLTTVPYYLPGFKGGGKLVTVRNLVGALNSRFQFKVMTADRDLGDPNPYAGIPTNRWISKRDCQIFYARSQTGSLRSIRAQLERADYDILHLNTMFSRPFGILPLLLRRFGSLARRPTIIAPRGELAPGALAIKSKRKKSFLAAARAFGLFNQVTWQASSIQEARDIRVIIGANASIAIASDLLSPDYQTWGPSHYRKRRGRLDIVFLSRISPVKNLDFAIETLRGLEGEITFRIAGPIDDAHYWAQCRKMMASLGSNIRVDYLGPIASSEVGKCFGGHGLFFLPTANESFGFVILEAMLAGCPVLISDHTPWRDLLQRGVGWDLTLSQPDSIRSVLRQCVAMDDEAHRWMSNRAREFALDYISHNDSAARNAALLERVLKDHRMAAAVS
jgi:glycosyltransferase involved in cell wall biosynthesis